LGPGFGWVLQKPLNYQQSSFIKIIFHILGEVFNWVFLKLILKNEDFQNNIKIKLLKLLNCGLGSGTGFKKNQTLVRVRVLGLKFYQIFGFCVRVQNRVRVRLHLWYVLALCELDLMCHIIIKNINALLLSY
jgi:hypothetical protein